ncbi:MAG TPA: hypothetical protein PKY87_06185 [Terricaulis sp.]|nr:hypothetical protein [Terricaulis sp.]
MRLNPELDPEPFARAYARDGYVQIPGIFPQEIAERFTAILEGPMAWEFVFLDENQRGVVITEAQQRALGPAALSAMLDGCAPSFALHRSSDMQTSSATLASAISATP